MLGAFSPLARMSAPAFSGNRFPIGPDRMDVLTEAQKLQLLEASLHFLAPDGESANRVAQEIDFIEGLNEHASTMCGPLSISILQRARLLGNWVQRNDFWLLNPREDLLTAQNTFPEGLYDWFYFEEPISQFNFKAFPLLAGDLLYLHAAEGDTFEHILVVNRVDSRGRAFTVSNFFTVTETIIEERMLYDPGNMAIGQFAHWSDRDIRNTIGNTGGAGFRLWRVKDGTDLELPQDATSLRLQKQLDALLQDGIGQWYAEIRDGEGKPLYQFNPYEAFHPASTIKVPIGLVFMDWLAEQNLDDEQEFLKVKGTAGRTFAQLLRAMLVESEEEATEALTEFLGENAIDQIWRDWGYTRTQINPRRSSAWELLNFIEGLIEGKDIQAGHREYLLQLLGTYTANDDTRSGLIKAQVPFDVAIYNKRGSLVEAPRVVGDSGLIEIPSMQDESLQRIYFSFHGLGKDGSRYEDLETKLDAACLALGEYLISSYPA